METRLKSNLNQASILAAVLAAALLLPPVPARSQPQNGSGNTGTFPASASMLDGRTFSARIVRDGADDQNRGLGDTLSFSGGKFSSKICRRFNFVDAPYWIRFENGKVLFRVELKSPTDGTMVWQGTISGDTLQGTMRWRKERWYWTIDATHKISGKLQAAAHAASPPAN